MSLNLTCRATRMSTITLVRGWIAKNRLTFTPSTCTTYTGVIWRFADFAPENIENLTAEHIERYIAYALKKLSRRTVDNHIGVIKSFCRWCSENYDIDNPAAKVKQLKYNPPKRRFITPEEYESVLVVCSETESRIIKLLYHTGLRASELQSLQISNIHGRTIRFAGKGRKERIVPLSKTAFDCIYKNGKPNMNFLESYRYRNALYHLCVRLSKRAGLDSVATPHSYRRFFGNSLIKKGVSIYFVSKMYGHATVQQTEQYLSCSAAELEGVTDCLD